MDVFVQLGLERIVIFRDDPASICIRLRERDGQDWPISMVEGHQEAEVEEGRIVAPNVNIPFLILDAGITAILSSSDATCPR